MHSFVETYRIRETLKAIKVLGRYRLVFFFFFLHTLVSMNLFITILPIWYLVSRIGLCLLLPSHGVILIVIWRQLSNIKAFQPGMPPRLPHSVEKITGFVSPKERYSVINEHKFLFYIAYGEVYCSGNLVQTCELYVNSLKKYAFIQIKILKFTLGKNRS